MERSWWWKALGILLLIVISVVYLLPGIVGEKALPSWYTKYVNKKIQLGLDLQGGIHLVYEVEVDKAVSDKADRLSADIEERLIKDKKVKVKILREGRDDIFVRFVKASDIKVVDKKFMSDYRANLDEIDRDLSTGQLRLRMDEDYVSEVQDYALRQGIETIRGRIDKFGVSEPAIRAKGRDITVELPGLGKKHFERVKKLIGRTAQLEFKIIDDTSKFMDKVAAKVKEGGLIKVHTDSYDGKKRGQVTFQYLQCKERKVLQAFIDNLASTGLVLPKDHEIAIGEVGGKDEKGAATGEPEWRSYYLFRRAELTGEYITDAEVQWDERTGRPEVSMTFDRNGASIFERISGDHIGERMAIILDEKVNSDPVFQSRIGGGRARITLGGFKDPFALQQEAKDLVAVLRTGALPAPLRKVFETQVGPTLGQDAVNKGMLAFMIGGGLVILFILYYYRGGGLICDLGLVINFLFIAAILTGLESTLTLPGIAGLVLTIGMAVDANVIIYERIREELNLGKSPRAAIDAGYGRAFWTIFDAQLTTAIAAFVLMQYGSGPIRGFAVTLLVGIVCSIFTGVVVTRLMFDFVVTKFRPKSLSI
jgi:preprotein translocase subunit SecD